MKVCNFIVDKRLLFFLIYGILIVFSVFSSKWVKVENDITEYLPKTTETRSGLDLMDKEFVTYGTAKFMVNTIPFDRARQLKDQIGDIDYVQSVDFTESYDDEDDFEDHYNNGSALYTVTFDFDEDDDRCLTGIQEVEDTLKGYDYYLYTELGDRDSINLNKEMRTIYVIVAIVIVSILLFTSQSYGEVPVLLLTFLSALILNEGTNFLFGTVSFVSKSVSSILQLALSIDYAIILCNRFKEERSNGYDVHDADVVALSKAIPEISSSSLTTISGLVSVIFMQFKIGQDLGMVLIKAIFLSLLSVFTLMPGLLMIFANLMSRSQHRNFVPKIDFVGKYAYATRHIVPLVFAAALIAGVIVSSKCPYSYSDTDMSTPILNDDKRAKNLIDETFGEDDILAVVVPHGDYGKEGALSRQLESCPEVDKVVGLANQEAMNGYNLTDELTPRQFAEMLGVDYDLCLGIYADDQEEYGRIVGGIDNYRVPVMDMLIFTYEKVDEGYVTLDDDTMQDLQDAYDAITDARAQLEGKDYDRMLVYLNLPDQGDETFAFLDDMHTMIREYYGKSNIWVVGDATSALDEKNSFQADTITVNVLSGLFVLIILLFTFKSIALPFLLIMVIEASISLNFSYPYIVKKPVYFMAYLIVSAIQMGANIDYAIVISSRYLDLRKSESLRDTIIDTMNFAFPTLLTSGSILTLAGFSIGMNTSNAVIEGVGECIGRGTLISLFLVLFALPQILLLGDRLIEKTSFDISHPVKTKSSKGTVLVNGRVRGYVNGMIVGTMHAYVTGDSQLSVLSGSAVDGEEEQENLIEGPIENEKARQRNKTPHQDQSDEKQKSQRDETQQQSQEDDLTIADIDRDGTVHRAGNQGEEDGHEK